MSAISLKSITGITSITTPAGVDNVFTVHTNDTTERFRVDSTGNLNIAGIVTVTKDLDVDGHTNLDNVSIAGVTTTSDNIHIKADNKQLKIGAHNDGDALLYHDGNKSVLVNYTGDFHIRTNNGSRSSLEGIVLKPNGATDLYYNGTGPKIQTASSGVNVSGTTTTTGLSVTGVSTFTGAIDANGDLDVDGHTNLDNVSIAGVTTTTGDVTVGSGGENSALGVRINSAYAQIKLPDGQTGANRKGNLSFGDNDDFRIVHDGHHNYITSGTGNIFISTPSANPVNIYNDRVAVTKDLDVTGDLDVDGTTNLDNVDIVGITTIRNASGTKLYEGVANGSKLFHAGTERLSTETYGIDINGELQCDTLDVSGTIDMNTDTGRLKIGAGDDLSLWHDGSNSYIANTGGQLRIWAKTDGYAITCTADGAVDLYHNNVSMFQTESRGAFVKKTGGGDTTFTVGSTDASGVRICLDGDSNGDAYSNDYAFLQHDTSGDFIISADNPAGNSNLIFKSGDSTERLKITSVGNIQHSSGSGVSYFNGSSEYIFGSTTSSPPAGGYESLLQVHTAKTRSAFTLAGYNNNAGGPFMTFLTSRSTTRGTLGSTIGSADTLGEIRFAGDNGTNYNSVAMGARISAKAASAPGSGDTVIAGRLMFGTGAATAASGSTNTVMELREDGALMLKRGRVNDNGSQLYCWGGYVTGTGTFTLDVPVFSGGNIYKIDMFFSHHSLNYGCYKYGVYGAYSGHSGLQINNDFGSHSSGNGGSFTVTRGSAGTAVVITKTAGTYTGGGYWFVNVYAGNYTAL